MPRQIRITAMAVLLSAAVLCFSGCSFIFPEASGKDELPALDSAIVEKYASEYQSRWRYERLDSRLKSGYAEMYAALREGFDSDEIVSISESSLDKNAVPHEYIGTKVRLSQPLRSREEAQQLYTALLWDNPRLFYISNLYSYEGYRVNNNNYYDVFCLAFTMNAEERKTAEHKLNTVVNEIIAPVYGSGKSQFDMQLALHDSLLNRCRYESRASEADDPMMLFPMAFTSYGALVDGTAVCEGYARAMQLLLHEVSIPCTLVSGIDLSSDVPHMWNFVTIDGLNYHLDPTWNDNDSGITHTFFNITTAAVLKSHSIDADNIGIDTSTATDAQYYRRIGRFIDSGQPGDIAAVIADGVMNGESLIDLQFTRAAFDSAIRFLGDSAALIPTVNGLLIGKSASMWAYRRTHNEMYYTVTLYKK